MMIIIRNNNRYLLREHAGNYLIVLTQGTSLRYDMQVFARVLLARGRGMLFERIVPPLLVFLCHHPLGCHHLLVLCSLPYRNPLDPSAEQGISIVTPLDCSSFVNFIPPRPSPDTAFFIHYQLQLQAYLVPALPCS